MRLRSTVRAMYEIPGNEIHNLPGRGRRRGEIVPAKGNRNEEARVISSGVALLLWRNECNNWEVENGNLIG